MEGEREARVGLNAVFKERMVWEGVRRGAKGVVKRVLRVDMLMCLLLWVTWSLFVWKGVCCVLSRGEIEGVREGEA